MLKDLTKYMLSSRLISHFDLFPRVIVNIQYLLVMLKASYDFIS
jgi:hypothetical protein